MHIKPVTFRIKALLITALLSVLLPWNPAQAALQPIATSSCQLAKSYQQTLSPGFPRDSNLTSSLGTIRSLFIFVDFPDNQSTNASKSLTDQYAVGAKKFLETQSYRRAQFIFDSTTKVFRINKKSTTYKLIQDGQGDGRALIQDAITAADSEIDFSQYDFVTVIPPANTTTIKFSGTITGGLDNFRSVERKFSSSIYIGQNKLSNLSARGFGWSFLSHEIGHVLGLMHPYYQRDGGPGAIWDLMGNGGTSVPEFIGWHRFLLGWITDNEILCLSNASAGTYEQTIKPINSTAKGKKFVMIGITPTTAIALESRRASSFDKLSTQEQGLLAYLVDVTKEDDQGIISILGPNKSIKEGQTLGTIASGQKLTFANVTIQLLASTKSGDKVRITSRG